MIEDWVGPKVQLKKKINIGEDPKYLRAFEIWVNGVKVHSEQQGNHGYLDTQDDEHKAAVKVAVLAAVEGKPASMPDAREEGTSQIQIETKKAARHVGRRRQQEEGGGRSREAES
jgi:hypothetical protein